MPSSPRPYDAAVGELQIEVLGPLRLWHRGEEIAVGGPAPCRLLAVLVAAGGHSVGIDTLVDAVWPEEPPRSAVPTVRTLVSRLRRHLADRLVTTTSGYGLRLGVGETDAGRLEQLRREAMDSSPATSIGLIEEALSLWRGEPYAGCLDIPVVLAEARRLEELHDALVEARVGLLIGTDPGAAVAAAEATLVDHPHREALWVHLVDALVATCRAVDATRAVTRAAAALAEVGLEPGAELRAAERRALSSPSEPAARRPPPARSRTTSFLGRERDVVALTELLAAHRLVTVVGPGGVGKTRLAEEVTAGREATVVHLASLATGDDIAAPIATALGLRAGDVDAEELMARAGHLDRLLVLDNAEHLLDEVAAVVEGALRGGPDLRVLVTSRERLDLGEEHVHPLAPLIHDHPTDPGPRLLLDRARAVGASVDPADPALQTITELLDGLPLALEMAAVQLTTCTPVELAARLAQGAVAELDGRRRGVEARHRSLGALLTWSIDRLDHIERELLRRSTVLAAPVTLDDVVELLGPAAAAPLRSLAEKSLVTTVRAGGRVRFGLLHVVREHIRATAPPLAEADRRAHARWCLALAERLDASLATLEETAARARLDELLGELRAAHSWAADLDRPTALELSAALHRYAQTGPHDELLGWAERLVAAEDPTDDPAHLAVVLASASVRAANRGRTDRARELAEHGLGLVDGERAPCLEALGDAELYAGGLDEAAAAYSELFEWADRADDPWGRLAGWSGVTLAAAYGGPDRRGRALSAEELADAPPSMRALAEYSIAELEAVTDPQAALVRYEAVVAVARRAPTPFVEGLALTSRAALLGRSGELADALAGHAEAISHWLALGDRSHLATCLRNLVTVLVRAGRDEDAVELAAGLEGCGVPTYGEEAERLAAAVGIATDRIGPDAARQARGRGAGCDLTTLAQRAREVAGS